MIKSTRLLLHALRAILAAAILGGLVVYAVYGLDRSEGMNILKGIVLTWAIPFSAFTAFVAVLAASARKENPSSFDVFKNYPWFAAATFAMVIWAVSALLAAWKFTGYLATGTPLYDQGLTITVTAIATLTVGALLFWFRLRRRFLYGFSEAAVGVVVAIHRSAFELSSAQPVGTGFYLAILTAGVYLVVRGMDNAYQGWADEKDPDAQRFRLLLRTPRPASNPPSPSGSN